VKSASRHQPPVFVHASPRSGSTYFFNVLRRNTSLMCFNEALMDGKNDVCRAAQSGERRSPSANKPTLWNVNHHFLDRPDNEEFIEAWDAVMHLFPAAPAFRDYLPADGVLKADVKAYLLGLNDHANAQGKRAAFCEINSRGRAGALRGAFGGFHAVQIRDPISQFGSFYRPLEEAGEWGFLLHPLKELGINGRHPLYEIVPEKWRPPVLPWPAADYTRRWASEVEYVLLLADGRPETLENAFRWHMFAWFLSNLAAAVYSDFVLDIDRVHDDAVYRTEVTKVFASETGMDVDFSDITKFSRYYQFEPFDAAAVASQVVSAVNGALADGRMEKALALLARSPVKIPARESTQLLFAKIENSVASFETSPNRRLVSNENWAQLVTKHAMPWSLARNRTLRETARVVYPFLAPVVRAVRRILQEANPIHNLDRRISNKG
jgi:hypothetical protein